MTFFERLDDVETKLEQTEREADKARKESKNARDHFNDVKSRRFVSLDFFHALRLQLDE